MSVRRKLLSAAICSFCILIGIAYANSILFKTKKELLVSVLSLSKGDTVLVTSPAKTRILIDAGGDRSILRALGQTLPPWVRSLDAFIETAKVSGATGGAADVRRYYNVGRVLTQADVHRGMRLDFGGGAYADVLYPDRDTSKMNPEDGAIVLRVIYGQTSFLIKENISARADEWLTKIDGPSPKGEVVIASSTPQGITYVSDGNHIEEE